MFSSAIGIAPTGTPPQVALARNGRLIPCELGPRQFLSKSPRGAYTAMRTVRAASIYEWDFHAQRLSDSIALMLKEQEESVPAPEALYKLVEKSVLKPLVQEQLAVAMRAYLEQYFPDVALAVEDGADAPELKVTVLIHWAEPSAVESELGYDVLVHASPLPPLPQSAADVQLLHAHRENAGAKDSDWVVASQTLWAQAASNAGDSVNEIVMIGPDGGLLEGLSSNLFIIDADGALVTPDDGILKGSVRKLVLETCERLDIPIKLEAPSFADHQTWQGMLISSTSRLALPIKTAFLPPPSSNTPAQVLEFDVSASSLAWRIRQATRAHIHKHSERILPSPQPAQSQA